MLLEMEKKSVAKISNFDIWSKSRDMGTSVHWRLGFFYWFSAQVPSVSTLKKCQCTDTWYCNQDLNFRGKGWEPKFPKDIYLPLFSRYVQPGRAEIWITGKIGENNFGKFGFLPGRAELSKKYCSYSFFLIFFVWGEETFPQFLSLYSEVGGRVQVKEKFQAKTFAIVK